MTSVIGDYENMKPIMTMVMMVTPILLCVSIEQHEMMVISEPPDRPADVDVEPRLAFSASAVLERRAPTTAPTDTLSGIGSSTSKASSSSSIGSAHPSLEDALSLDDDSDLSQKDDEKKEVAFVPRGVNPFLLPRSPARLFMGGLVTSAMSSVTSSKSPSLAASKAPSVDLMASNAQDEPSEPSEPSERSPEQSVIEQVLERIEATQPIAIPTSPALDELAQSPPTCWADSGVCVQAKPGVSSEDDATAAMASESSTSGRYHTPPRGRPAAGTPSGNAVVKNSPLLP